MKRIELIGSAGVGKTTLYNAMAKQSMSSNAWLTPTQASYQIVRHILSQKNKKLRFFYKYGLHLPLITDFINKKTLKNEYDLAFYERKKEWEDFIYSVLQLKFNTKPNSIQTLYRYSWLLSRLEEAALLEKYLSHCIHSIFQEEAVLHKTTQLLGIFDEKEDVIENLFRVAPKPNAIIYLLADSETIISRLSIRENNKSEWMIGFRGISENELVRQIEKIVKCVDICANVMKDRGVNFLTVEATLPLEQQLYKANSFITSIS
jgi:deoxyadenosine/deoxycytidine kinase